VNAPRWKTYPSPAILVVVERELLAHALAELLQRYWQPAAHVKEMDLHAIAQLENVLVRLAQSRTSK